MSTSARFTPNLEDFVEVFWRILSVTAVKQSENNEPFQNNENNE